MSEGTLSPRPLVWSVGTLLLAVSDTLAARFGAVTVRGELAGFTRAASGHCYFNLKDESGSAGLRCAMFRRAAQTAGFAPRDGMRVEVRGRLSVYEARGELQMVVESMQQQGAGNLFEEFLRLRAKLEAEGLFDPACRRPLPSHPACLAVVTSLGSAAMHDVLTALKRRAPHVRVHLYPSLVQGAEAPAALVAALARAQEDAAADAVLLCRGGGSLEDLWSFNDERVVRAVAACRLPLVCGVGHETDVTLADLAADLRAATPTAAAELAAPARADLAEELQHVAARMQRRMAQRLDGAVQGLDNLSLRLQRPAQLLAPQALKLAALAHRHQASLRRSLDRLQAREQQLGERWVRAGRLILERQRTLCERQAQRLDAQDPHRVLQRGYAWIAQPDGQAVVSVRELVVGQPLRAVWADGQAMVRVDEVEPGGRT